MSEHKKRKKDIFFNALPHESSLEYIDLIKKLEKWKVKNPSFDNVAKEKYNKASRSLFVQNLNGINLGMDKEIRHFLREFNNRAWEHGLISMPLMFNIMEAFFKYDRTILYFELLKEEDYLISFFDFLDFYTSKGFLGNIQTIKENLEEDLIYNYNVGADLDKLTFKGNDSEEFVIGGISMVRRKNEVTILLQVGQISDTVKITKGLEQPRHRIPGREKIRPDENLKLEAVRLNDNPNYWKNLVSCRFDLDTETLDARYVAKDFGNHYAIQTDEIDGFVNAKGDFLSQDIETAFRNSMKEIENYSSIYEIAKIVLHLPYYFNEFEDDIFEEEHDTEFKKISMSVIEKRKFNVVNDKFKERQKILWVIDNKKKFSVDRLKINDEKFKIDTSGYWKNLRADEFGMDKNGKQITGRTWVVRKETYYQANTDELIITNKAKELFTNENAGYIYVMRNPFFPTNTFKIGLTRFDPENRASQLSKTSVPDKFHIMNEWMVKDCVRAEKEIHNLLERYRDDPRREFFTLDMENITKVITEVVKNINM